MKDYYSILEVNKNASKEVIEKAYKVLAKKYHPDLQRNKEAAEKKLKEINEAYDVLSDSFLKEQYDRELKEKSMANKNTPYQETDYSRLYKEKERLKYNLAREKQEKDRILTRNLKKESNPEEETNSFGIIPLMKSLFASIPRMIKSLKNIKEIDILALVLTIIIVILIGVALYWIPFTHDWMNKNFIDTPLVNWIKGLF